MRTRMSGVWEGRSREASAILTRTSLAASVRLIAFPFSLMKITKVETIYLRQRTVKELCDSGQDALIIRIETDEGITGIGEVDSNPRAVKGAIDGPFSHT